MPGTHHKTISIAIPTYEMSGKGGIFLEQSFILLAKQTYTDFDVIISDHSRNTAIEEVCKKYHDILDIKYYKNPNHYGSSSANINNAITKAQGSLIKILFQDDFLYNPHSLEETVYHFDIQNDRWLVSAFEHSNDGITFYKPYYPRYNDKIHLGDNTMGPPSILTIRNEEHLLFDEALLWLMDCDYYKRCYLTFGAPKILSTITVVSRTGEHQVSNTLIHKALQKKEKQYIISKYRGTIPWWKVLFFK